MKLSQTIAKLTGGKVKVLGVLGGLMLTGAAMTAAAPAADAQVAFGVRIGTPRYYAPQPAPVYGYADPAYGYAAPAYPAYGYVAPRYNWEQRREWREHEYWEHHDQDRRFDRDHDRERRDWR